MESSSAKAGLTARSKRSVEEDTKIIDTVLRVKLRIPQTNDFNSTVLDWA